MTKLNSDLTPSKIIEHLNRYIVGQDKAKRAVAIALRNRIRRRALPPEISHEIMPKNILMVGPTGVGKTEIARRLATLSNAPFVKVEATKFTEVGYVGRDVETIIRDLTEFAVSMVRKKLIEEVQAPARVRAEDRLLDALLPKREKKFSMPDFMKAFTDKSDEEKNLPDESEEDIEETVQYKRTRAKFQKMLDVGKLDDKEVEIEVNDTMTALPIFGSPGMDVMGINITEMIGGIMPKKTKKRHMKVKEAMRILQQEEAEKLIDTEAMTKQALEMTQEEGIVFLDEIDKVVVKGGSSNGPDVSREGVQRDLLPIVEGSVVQTRYGPVKTDHILFIAAGAFSGVKPSDLIPELQGRFPIRVELEPLTIENLERILTEPENSLIRQYEALISTEGTELTFTKDATEEIAKLAHKMNSEMEDIGARRLHTMMEQLLEEISFNVCDMDAEKIEITAETVKEKLSGLVENRDIRRYLL
ncbi:MAG: ATP-dependent protease ATPase subunit HslU [Synergistaceae bacterium]|nr:ATP-dependent protease ATPase subunit HslU [Synergistaceae bacterium]MBQ7067893.1 ATP-dependent protease ATPase subunit HslU [Synergistaceae bacterium]MBR0079289.1 ATP-dependent protease ATPase subunit HslU [Synergistaceae bacterium]MBR0252490.1 ATP-dependent protease ATPase subunit HslU [Synergistaceae bacterium]MBR0316581.1 ATP-dependent protease ATPase subunit HslU [Synergistaceae bacterium]